MPVACSAHLQTCYWQKTLRQSLASLCAALQAAREPLLLLSDRVLPIMAGHHRPMCLLMASLRPAAEQGQQLASLQPPYPVVRAPSNVLQARLCE